MHKSPVLSTLLLVWLLGLGTVSATLQSVLQDALTVDKFHPFSSNSTVHLLQSLYNLRRATGEPLSDQKVLEHILFKDEDIELISRTEVEMLRNFINQLWLGTVRTRKKRTSTSITHS